MATVIGLSCKLYRGTAGARAATEMTNVGDLRLVLENIEADVTTRASGGWKLSIAALHDAELKFDMLYDAADADFNAVRAAYFDRSALALFVTDGAGSGLDCDCVVTAFRIHQGLSGAVKVGITLRPTPLGGRVPAWVQPT